MVNLIMSSEVIFPSSLIFTLVTGISDTFVFGFLVCLKKTMLCCLIITLVSGSLSATVYGDQAELQYCRWGRTYTLYNLVKVNLSL